MATNKPKQKPAPAVESKPEEKPASARTDRLAARFLSDIQKDAEFLANGPDAPVDPDGEAFRRFVLHKLAFLELLILDEVHAHESLVRFANFVNQRR